MVVERVERVVVEVEREVVEEEREVVEVEVVEEEPRQDREQVVPTAAHQGASCHPHPHTKPCHTLPCNAIPYPSIRCHNVACHTMPRLPHSPHISGISHTSPAYHHVISFTCGLV